MESSGPADLQLVREGRIFEALNRQGTIGSLEALASAFRGDAPGARVASSALVIDASAFLRLSTYVDVVDYLNLRHAPPVVLPGQAIQEFWNNFNSAHQAITTGIRSKFDQLKAEIAKVDGEFEDFSTRFGELITEFNDSFGYAYDGETVRRTISLFEALEGKASVSYARREPFIGLAAIRNATKTPPGFKDNGDGDFFIWIDALEGLLAAKDAGEEFEHVVLITNDKKVDWSRDGIPHPVLTAEVDALLGVPLSMWDVKKLAAQIDAE